MSDAPYYFLKVREAAEKATPAMIKAGASFRVLTIREGDGNVCHAYIAPADVARLFNTMMEAAQPRTAMRMADDLERGAETIIPRLISRLERALSGEPIRDADEALAEARAYLSSLSKSEGT